MQTFPIKHYELRWLVSANRGELLIDFAGNDNKFDLKLDIATVEELAAWGNALREGGISRVTLDPRNVATAILHTA